MKVKARLESVRKLKDLLNVQWDNSQIIKEFLDELPTPEKYSIVAMAWVITSNYEDYEDALDEIQRQVHPERLTDFILNFRFLECHLHDAMAKGLKWFDCVNTNDEPDED